MYFLEEEESYGEDEISILIQEAVNDPINNDLRTFIIDPIIKVLEKPAGKTQYIKYGSEFLEANAEMLSKEYPTKQVSFPKGYVDNIFMLFGFDAKPFKDMMNFLVTASAIHAERQTHEMADCMAMLRDLDIAPTMTEATMKRLQWLADKKMKEKFGGKVPARWQDVVQAWSE